MQLWAKQSPKWSFNLKNTFFFNSKITLKALEMF